MKNEALIKARKENRMTQEDLAAVLGCTKGAVSNWENGVANPTLPDAFRVAQVLKSDVNVLFVGLKVQGSCTSSKRSTA